MRYAYAKKRGFTLIEMLVAVFILSLVIAATSVVVRQSLVVSFVARDDVTAFFLAQEAVEYVKNVRDNGDWLDDVPNFCKGGPTSSGCAVDVFEEVFISSCNYNNVDQSRGCQLKYDNGKYQHDSGTDTDFYRAVRIVETGDNEAYVDVIVSYNDRTFEAQEYIYDWRP